MIPPLVSVVLPCFNSEAYLGECLFGLSQSTYPNLEIVIVDDGSTDSTPEIVSQFCGAIEYVRLEQNRGLAGALNVGLAKASGDYIARLDADDIAMPWRFFEQVKFLLSNPRIDVVGTGAEVFGAIHTEYRSPEHHADIVNAFLVGNPIIHPTIMVRRRALENGIFRYDETAHNEEDYDLWSRLIVGGTKLANQQFSAIRYRIHDSNNQMHPAKRSVKERALRRFCDHFGIAGDFDLDHLLDFQCSNFLSKEAYQALRAYSFKADERAWPHLGWIHARIKSCENYRAFSQWYWWAKGLRSIA